jgi:hypothetical protein
MEAYTIVSTHPRKYGPAWEKYIPDRLKHVAKEAARLRNLGYPCKVIDADGREVA